ncbi:MAG: hypothetical protein ACYS7M_02260, partial [Planctomycetota bacterium]
MMSEPATSDGAAKKAAKALERRAKGILKARPAYKEMVGFYLTVFRRQIEWRDRLVVHPVTVDSDQRRQCLSAGQPLVESYDPGIESGSLLELWMEMKAVFRRGNDVLRRAVDKIDGAETAGDFVPATWLSELRPDRGELVVEASRRMGVEEAFLATLARAVTFPHWHLVSRSWLPGNGLEEWRRF